MSDKNTPYLQAIMWLLVLLVCATPGARSLLPLLGTTVLVYLVGVGLLVIPVLLVVGGLVLLVRLDQARAWIVRPLDGLYGAMARRWGFPATPGASRFLNRVLGGTLLGGLALLGPLAIALSLTLGGAWAILAVQDAWSGRS